MNLNNEQLQETTVSYDNGETYDPITVSAVKDENALIAIPRKEYAELLSSRATIRELERERDGLKTIKDALENDVANATMNLEHIEAENAELRAAAKAAADWYDSIIEYELPEDSTADTDVLFARLRELASDEPDAADRLMQVRLGKEAE